MNVSRSLIGMFIMFKDQLWCTPEIKVNPFMPRFILTDEEVGNIPWDQVTEVGMRDPVLFSFPSSVLSTRFTGVTHFWMRKAPDGLMTFAMGTHTRVGEASILRVLAGQPEILGMIAEYVTN